MSKKQIKRRRKAPIHMYTLNVGYEPGSTEALITLENLRSMMKSFHRRKFTSIIQTWVDGKSVAMETLIVGERMTRIYDEHGKEVKPS